MLSNIRAAGIQSLVLYRNGTMNTLLRNEMLKPADSRLMVSEVEEWGTLIEEIAGHLKASCTVDVEATWPTYRWRFLAEKIRFERECTEPLVNVTPKATHLHAYGFKGYSDLNRSWFHNSHLLAPPGRWPSLRSKKSHGQGRTSSMSGDMSYGSSQTTSF